MDTTLLKGLRVLDAIARSPRPRGISELAQELGLPKSNVHRSIRTLVHAQFVRQVEESGKYESTLKLFELGSLCLGRFDVRKLGQSEMRRLADLTSETIHLSTLDSTDVIYIDKIESPQPVRAYSQVGGRAPAHCVASGKAQLAFAGNSLLSDLPDPLPTFSPKSISSKAQLASELLRVRQLGVAENHGEWRESVGGVAAPIFDFSGSCVAAIGVSGPLERLSSAVRKKMAKEVLLSARAISRSLGGNLDHHFNNQDRK